MVEETGLTPEQIYNADNTGLLWKCLPQRTLVSSHKNLPQDSRKQTMCYFLCLHYCLIFIMRTLDYPDNLLKSQRARMIEVLVNGVEISEGHPHDVMSVIRLYSLSVLYISLKGLCHTISYNYFQEAKRCFQIN